MFDSVREVLAKLSALLSLVRNPDCGCLKKVASMRNMKFVDVIYDDWHGVKRPIGLVHEIKLPNGQKREVFTFCAPGKRQPDMALFVKRREGNLSDNIALTFDGQEMIPDFLKSLPDEYRAAYITPVGQPQMQMAS